jgi:lipid-binding SYLF domain-containing protein
MTRKLLVSTLLLMLLPPLARAGEVEDRVVRSAIVLREIMGIRESGIPQDLIDKSACVMVIPGMLKGGFIGAVTYGKGTMSCRVDAGEGPWSAPSMTMIGGGSFGLQIGGQATDLVLLIMNMRGVRSLLDSQFTLGADASVAAGPVGRTTSAETDAWMSAEILAWSRSRGLFGGISVKGSVVRPDNDANRVLYGKEVSARDLLYYRTENPPRDAKILIDELTKISPTRKTN